MQDKRARAVFTTMARLSLKMHIRLKHILWRKPCFQLIYQLPKDTGMKLGYNADYNLRYVYKKFLFLDLRIFIWIGLWKAKTVFLMSQHWILTAWKTIILIHQWIYPYLILFSISIPSKITTVYKEKGLSE